LARHGMVEAIRKLGAGRGVSRLVRPGEYATDRNIANMWINQNIFDRNIRFYQAEAITLTDAEFSTTNTRGFGTLAPGGGTSLLDLSTRLSGIIPPTGGGLFPSTVVLQPEPIGRPEGNFGTPDVFRILLPRGIRR
ncbi:MAG: hypothetical protein ACE5E6_13005, partial [Phycisphaerae bacterium]